MGGAAGVGGADSGVLPAAQVKIRTFVFCLVKSLIIGVNADLRGLDCVVDFIISVRETFCST